VRSVAAETLACALRWEHRVGEDGASFLADLADGERLASVSIDGVLNRLPGLPPNVFDSAAPAERAYALQEAHAFFVSWLSSLPVPVIPRATPQALSGTPRSELEWQLLASRAGLAVDERRWTASQDGAVRGDAEHGREQVAIVLGDRRFGGGRVFGAFLSEREQRCCLDLAGAAETELLAVSFRRGRRAWTFAGATEWADLRLGGAPLLDALAARLSAAGRQR
jgi:hypothetical protein